MSEFVEINEHREHAEHAAHTKDPFAGRVSILVAVLAVVTAATGSLENTETAGAITEASHAVLDQDRATDQWNLYQAKSLKKNMFDIAASAGAGGQRAGDYAKKSAHEAADEGGAQAKAKDLEHARDEALEASERHEKHHHRLAIAATLLEIGIAISTIAIITRRHWPWAMAAILGVGGVAIAVSAYL
jgi:hypothetical protein